MNKIYSDAIQKWKRTCCFRFGLFERTSDFEKKEKLSSSITILFVIGVTIWTLSIVALFVFATYKTYIYYRRREHAANAGDHDY